jgi:hypothetical protein
VLDSVSVPGLLQRLCIKASWTVCELSCSVGISQCVCVCVCVFRSVKGVLDSVSVTGWLQRLCIKAC